MTISKITLAAAAAISAFTALPAAAQAQRYDGYYDRGSYAQNYRGDRRAERRYERQAERRYYRNQYRNDRNCKSGTTAAIIGGAAGALLGREIDGGRERTLGTILGGAAGALAGRELTRTC